MVMQYKSKKSRSWRKYNGKDRLQKPISNYEFRLLSENKDKVLVKGSYNKVLKRFRAIEYYKHH